MIEARSTVAELSAGSVARRVRDEAEIIKLAGIIDAARRRSPYDLLGAALRRVAVRHLLRRSPAASTRCDAGRRRAEPGAADRRAGAAPGRAVRGAAACGRGRPGRHQHGVGRRAGGQRPGNSAGPRRGRAAQLRPAHARGAQSGRHRPSRGPVPGARPSRRGTTCSRSASRRNASPSPETPSSTSRPG